MSLLLWLAALVLLLLVLVNLGEFLRGTVRAAVPLLCLAVFGAFVWLVPQGSEVLRGLAERHFDTSLGGDVSGPLWLAAGASALGLSLWYSLRWLLGAEMPGLPLRPQPGLFRTWLPRCAGAAPAAFVSLGFQKLSSQPGASPLMWVFAALAVLTLALLAGRGALMAALQARGWLAAGLGRQLVAAGPVGLRSLAPGQLPVQQPLPWVSQVIVFWGLAISFLFTLLLIGFPVGVPPDIGAAALAALALAAINVFGSFVLSFWPLRHGLPHLAPWAVLLAGLIGAWTDNHRVQPAAPLPQSQPSPRLSVHEAFQQHLQARKAEAAAGAPPVVFFIASEGGGIRAAFWTAELLRQLSERRPDLARETFALSGVSGGSLGLASWLATERQRLCPKPSIDGRAGLKLDWAGKDGVKQNPVSARLGMDFLSAPVAGLLFYDLLQRFWPHAISSFDRSRALEQSWQRAHADLSGHPMASPLWTWYEQCEQAPLPHLMLNTTVVETGQRAVLTRLDADLSAKSASAPAPEPAASSVFVNAWQQGSHDLMDPQRYSSANQSTAGLVHHSARFPALSPAGTVERIEGEQGPVPVLRLVDGGYYDNSGAQTLTDLIDYLCRVQKTGGPAFRPMVLLIRNAPEPFTGEARKDAPPSALFPEIGSIVGALYEARSSHAVTARMQLLQRLDEDLLDLAVPLDSDAAKGALGWSLAGKTQQNYIDAAAKVAGGVVDELKKRLAKPASKGCTEQATYALPASMSAASAASAPTTPPPPPAAAASARSAQVQSTLAGARP